MKIEYLDGDDEFLPLIRMYEFQPEEVDVLCRICDNFANGKIREYVLHEQSWIKAITGCQFVWRVHQKDNGVIQTSTLAFELTLKPESWINVKEILLYFTQRAPQCFHWLNEIGDAHVLISYSGSW